MGSTPVAHLARHKRTRFLLLGMVELRVSIVQNVANVTQMPGSLVNRIASDLLHPHSRWDGA